MFDQVDSEVEWAGSTYQTILRKENSGGAMSIVDSTSQPNVGPPRHVHEAADEAFVVLSGEVEFWLDGETFRRGPGETAFIPRGVEHTFRVVSDTPSRHLVILTPGGFEGFSTLWQHATFRFLLICRRLIKKHRVLIYALRVRRWDKLDFMSRGPISLKGKNNPSHS